MNRVAGVIGCVVFLSFGVFMGFMFPGVLSHLLREPVAPLPAIIAAWVLVYGLVAGCLAMAVAFAVMAKEG